MSERTMPFGKHKGEYLSDVPQEYLEWLLENTELRQPLKRWVEEELGEASEEPLATSKSDELRERLERIEERLSDLEARP